MVCGTAEARREKQCPPVVDVGVVLPGEADTAVHLDAVLRALLGGGRGQRRRDRGGEPEMRSLGTFFPHLIKALAASHTAAVARSVTATMLAHLCLTAWN